MTVQREGNWFQTYTGKQFYPLDPRPEDIDLDDIVHHLSHLCRFNGGTREFYSVAQHSVIVADALPDDFKLWGLLHDAAESFLADSMPLAMALEAAKQNDAEAKVNLGMMALEGKGMAPNGSMALRLFIEAAQQGHVGAQHNLGIMYYQGISVRKDPVHAYAWFDVSAMGELIPCPIALLAWARDL